MHEKECQFIAQLSLLRKESILLPKRGSGVIGLLYLRTGEARLTGAEGAAFSAGAQTAAVFPGWQEHRLTAAQGTSLLLCGFQCAGAEELLAHRMQTQGAVSSVTQMPEAKRLLPQLNALSAPAAWDFAAEPAAQLLSAMLGQRPADRDVPAYLRKARRLIELQYAEELSLETLAAQIGRSKYHLSRRFREYYHITPGVYLTSVRLSRAAELLTRSDLPDREVGTRVGIPNSTYFTALFKERYGRPPRQYRLADRAEKAGQKKPERQAPFRGGGSE